MTQKGATRTRGSASSGRRGGRTGQDRVRRTASGHPRSTGRSSTGGTSRSGTGRSGTGRGAPRGQRPQATSRSARQGAPPPGGRRRPEPGTPARRPHPDQATFRRRRLVALAIVLVLLGGIIAGVTLGVRAALAALDRADQAPPRPTAEVSEGAQGERTGPPSDDELANPVDCRPSAVGLQVEIAGSVSEGATTKIPVTVTNTGQVPCLLDVGTAELVLDIYSGDDHVWSSRRCTTYTDRRILLDIGADDATTFPWRGERNSSGCGDDKSTAKPGTYRVSATLWTAVPEDSDADPEQIAQVEETFTVR